MSHEHEHLTWTEISNMVDEENIKIKAALAAEGIVPDRIWSYSYCKMAAARYSDDTLSLIARTMTSEIDHWISEFRLAINEEIVNRELEKTILDE